MRIWASLLSLALVLLPSIANANGPAWWRVDNGGGSVLWILGIPDGMLTDLKWNDDALHTRIGAARLLISPLLGAPTSAPDHLRGSTYVIPVKEGNPFTTLDGKPVRPSDMHRPYAYPIVDSQPWDYALPTSPGSPNALWDNGIQIVNGGHEPIDGVYARTIGADPFRTRNDPLSARLPASLLARTTAAISAHVPGSSLSFGGQLRDQLQHAKTWEVALWLDLWNWPNGKLGNAVTTEAQQLATARHLPVQMVYVPALWKPILVDPQRPPPLTEPFGDWNWLGKLQANIRVTPPESLQQTCLARVLDESESGQMPARRQGGMQAWANGDVEHALRRSNDVQLCLMGDLPSTGRTDYERGEASVYIQALDQAFEDKGETVALVEFDPLLLESNGVLDHYRRLGYDIVQSDGLGA